jgi:hypothetical protein
MRFTDGAVGHKSTRKVTKVFSQGSYELGHDREDEMVNADGGADGEDCYAHVQSKDSVRLF